MRKIVGLAVLGVLLSTTVKAQFLKEMKKKAESQLAKKDALTEEEVGKGLKEALTKGVEKGVAQVSKADGFFKDPTIKLPFPEDAKKAETKLRKLGQGKKCDEAILSMNRGAEEASKEAKDIFVDAIKAMTIQDAFNILKGEDNAATSYLMKATTAQLKEKFKPIVKAALEKVGATKHWATVVNAHNKLPGVKKINPDLVDYVTDKAIAGLFVQVAKEEKKIRENPGARTSDLLKKVFKEQD